MTRDAIVEQLAANAQSLAANAVEQDRLYAARLVLWQAGQALDPPMKHRELAAPSLVTEGAVTQALRKVRLAEGVG
jgi:hypothetical protein